MHTVTDVVTNGGGSSFLCDLAREGGGVCENVKERRTAPFDKVLFSRLLKSALAQLELDSVDLLQKILLFVERFGRDCRSPQSTLARQHRRTVLRLEIIDPRLKPTVDRSACRVP
jgi:hypothetical protein